MMELFQSILQVSVTTSVMILLLSITHPILFKRYSAKWCYIIWFVVAIRLLVPFTLSIPQAIFYVPLSTTVSQPIRTMVENKSGANKTDVITQQNITNTNHSNNESTVLSKNSPSNKTAKKHFQIKDVSPIQIVLILWLGGCITFIIYNLIGYFLQKKSIFRWGTPVKSIYVLDMIELLKRELQIKKSIRVMVSKQINVPMIIGFTKPIIWLPHEEYSQRDIEFILKHELIHHKHHDTLYKAVLFLVQAIHWFNPIVLLMKYYANVAIEIYCDETLIENKDPSFRQTYSEIILSSIKARNGQKIIFSTYFSGEYKTIKMRLSNILSRKKGKKGIIAAAIAILLIITASALIASNSESIGKTSKDNMNLTNHLVTFKDINTNMENSTNIIGALEGQKLKLKYIKVDDSFVSFNPEARFASTKKEVSMIKEVIKEKTIDDYKVLAYKYSDDNFYLGYIKNNILYCLDSFKSERKHYIDSIAFSQFENVLGSEKGFTVSCIMEKINDQTLMQISYYKINGNGMPEALTSCYNEVKEVDLNDDGMKEIIFSAGEAFWIGIQVNRKNDVYMSSLGADINEKIETLLGRPLGNTEVRYDESKNAFYFCNGAKAQGDYIEGYLYW